MGKRTGIILAWDKSEFTDRDVDLLNSIEPCIDYIKVGLEAIYSPKTDGETVAEQVSGWMYDQHGKKTMWDAKLHDVGNTVDKAIRNILNKTDRIQMLTIHATMSDGALNLANVACAQANVTALAVTVLTDIDKLQCELRYGTSSFGAVNNLAKNAFRCGIKGLVCSGQELSSLELPDMIKIVPGIRPTWAAANDQKRVMTPAEAAKAGADYIVVGRPILEPPSGMTPLEAVKRIRDELDTASAQ